MGQLRRSDLESAFEFLGRIGAPASVDTFAHAVVDGLRRLIPCDMASYNEDHLAERRALVVVDPADSWVPEQEPFDIHMGEHPSLTYYDRTGDGRAVKISDFMSRRQFHHTGLYQGVFKPVETEDVLSICVKTAARGAHIALAVHRGKEGFTERERALLDLLRPHLSALYRSARAQEELEALRQAVSGDEGELVRLLRERSSQERTPPFQKQRAALSPGALAVLGLSARETEIVMWVAKGRTNAQIADELCVSPHTVKRHLERIYDKLGTRSRTALTARAFKAAAG